MAEGYRGGRSRASAGFAVVLLAAAALAGLSPLAPAAASTTPERR
ncbi:hypothetical protein [Nonomuraea sp. SBT364]|nr:hypothetical protein [Nonomuraea sp. SBT364]